MAAIFFALDIVGLSGLIELAFFAKPLDASTRPCGGCFTLNFYGSLKEANKYIIVQLLLIKSLYIQSIIHKISKYHSLAWFKL